MRLYYPTLQCCWYRYYIIFWQLNFTSLHLNLTKHANILCHHNTWWQPEMTVYNNAFLELLGLLFFVSGLCWFMFMTCDHFEFSLETNVWWDHTPGCYSNVFCRFHRGNMCCLWTIMKISVIKPFEWFFSGYFGFPHNVALILIIKLLRMAVWLT